MSGLTHKDGYNRAMLSAELNDTLTRVGPGTRMGNLLRRYWYPVAALADFEQRWTRRVRLLGEDLVLFKDRTGRFGLLEEQCPHRRASLYYGMPTEHGIRCPYHGWHLDAAGRCVDQPNEEKPEALKGKVLTTSYPVESMGGLIWAYLGPRPAPILPRFDGFVAENAIRICGRTLLPANWLQIMENSVDPIHTEWLHGHHYQFLKEQEGVELAISRHHVKVAFDEFEYGIIKRRLLEGQSEDSDDWRVGHPLIFPNMLSVGNGDQHSRSYNFQIRVPVDDTNTLNFWYVAYVPPAGAKVLQHLLERTPAYEVPYKDEQGEFIVDFVEGEDMMAWVTQGAIADRTRESLGTTDSGLVVFRRMLEREMEKVERGKHHFSDGFASRIRRSHVRYSQVGEEIIAVFESGRS